MIKGWRENPEWVRFIYETQVAAHERVVRLQLEMAKAQADHSLALARLQLDAAVVARDSMEAPYVSNTH